MARYSQTAAKLLPHLLQELSQVEPIIIAAAGGGGSLAVHDLSGAYHTGTLAESQAPWAVTATTFATHEANTEAHHATATAGNGISVSGQQISLASSAAGAGLTYTTGVLAVGAGTLLTVAADSIGVSAGSNYQFVGTGSGTAAGWRNVSELAGNGLTAATGVLAVGAGTLLTVAADTVGVSPGAAYQFIGTGSDTGAEWRNVSELAGNGLTAATGVLAVGAGNGLTVAADSVALTTPGTLAVSSSNNAAGSHTHAITSSSNPGAAASILATNATGGLTLTGTLSVPLIVAAANLTINPTGDLTLNPGGGEIFIPGADTMRSETWTSGVLGTGWGLQERGGAGRSHLDIRSIYCDELIATTFTADQVRVRSGSDWLGEALAIAARDNSDNKVTIPNVGGGSVRIYVENVPEITGQIFDSNEYVLIKTINRSTGLVIRETWGQVSSYIAETGGRQSYSWTTVSGSGNFTLEPGTALTGFGVSSGSYIFRTVIETGRGPVERFATWSGNPYTPANRTSRVEIGDIKNAAGDSTTRYGIAAGNNLALTPTTGFSGLTVDSVNGVRIYNSDIGLYQSGAPVVTIERDAGIDLAAYTTLLPPDYIRQIAWWADLTSKTTPIARQWAAATGGNDYYNIHVDRPTGVSNYLFDVVVGNSAAGAQFVLTATPSPAYSTATLFADQILFSTTPKVGSFYASAATMWHADNDGTGSGLDADKLDSYHAAAFVLATDYEDSDVLTKVKNVDGASSGLDADTLDGSHGSEYALRLNPIFAGKIGFNADNANYYIGGITNGLKIHSYSVVDFELSSSAGEWRFLNGSVLMGTTSNPYSARLNVSGNIHATGVVTSEEYIQIEQRSGSPGSASGFGRIYYDSGDDKLKYVTSGGTVRTLSYT